MANVRYLVTDVDAALDFYVGRLGFELVERWGPPFAMVRRGDLTLWLSGPGTSAARPMPDGAQPVPGGWNRLVLEVDELDATIHALRAAGVAHVQLAAAASAQLRPVGCLPAWASSIASSELVKARS